MAVVLKEEGDAEVQGLAEITKKLDRLPDNIRRRIYRGAARSAADIMRGEAGYRVPIGTRTSVVRGKRYDPGTYSRSLSAKTKIEADGVRGRVRSSDPKAYWIEFGHKTVDGKDVPAQPAMRDTLEAVEGQIVNLVVNRLQNGLEKALK